MKGHHTVQCLIDTIFKEIELRDRKIQDLIRHIETMNKVSVPISNRKLEIQEVNSSSSKITINPYTGRVTLKVSVKSSEKVRKEYDTFNSTNH